jgi:biopolymer transport protein ExbD
MSLKSLKKEMSAPMEMNMTPMIDVSFLLIIFFICLPMKMLEGKIQAFLPTDKGINPTPTEPPLEIKVSVHIVARNEQPMLYPPPRPDGSTNDGIPRETKSVPTLFRFKIGNDETANLVEVYDYIKKAYGAVKDTPNAKITGEIKAGHKVPHKYVVAVLNKFAEAGMEKVDFYGTAIPPRNLRQAKYLPYPLKNYETAD